MNNAKFTEWIHALESCEYGQVVGNLRIGDCYCVTGLGVVVADIPGEWLQIGTNYEDDIVHEAELDHDAPVYDFFPSSGKPVNVALADAFGISVDDVLYLQESNDNYEDFISLSLDMRHYMQHGEWSDIVLSMDDAQANAHRVRYNYSIVQSAMKDMVRLTQLIVDEVNERLEKDPKDTQSRIAMIAAFSDYDLGIVRKMYNGFKMQEVNGWIDRDTPLEWEEKDAS